MFISFVSTKTFDKNVAVCLVLILCMRFRWSCKLQAARDASGLFNAFKVDKCLLSLAWQIFGNFKDYGLTLRNESTSLLRVKLSLKRTDFTRAESSFLSMWQRFVVMWSVIKTKAMTETLKLMTDFKFQKKMRLLARIKPGRKIFKAKFWMCRNSLTLYNKLISERA